jgi:exopolysaccharide/PEP-CTERM locus tyrosine autokinase
MGLIERAGRRLGEQRRAGPPVVHSLAESTQEPERRAGPRVVHSRAESTHAPEGQARASTLKLNLAKLAAEGFVTPDLPRSRIADEFRVIKRPLIANASSQIKNGNLIMVTSSMPGEGKSFSSVNLAMSIAMEMDRTVLLVDADVARPSLPRTLGIPDTPGLLDVLDEQSADLNQVLLRTNVEKLTFLSSGSLHTRAAEMLASDAMSDLLHELATRYADRIVIFDSPPLLVTTEARVLASHLGQIVFIVDAESTPQSEVKRALATIEACPVKLMVLNKARTAAQGAYGYGYGYGY